MGRDQPHKNSNQGFASSKYNPEKSRGGKAPVAKGFAKLSPEKRREVARNII